MPELPDLVYIASHLNSATVGRTIVEVQVKQPIVIRDTLDIPFDVALIGKIISSVTVHGPFLTFGFTEGIELVINLMRAGGLQHQFPHEKPEGYFCFGLSLNDGTRLNLGDEQRMAKAYLIRRGLYQLIPKYATQGIDIRSPEFTPDEFRRLASASKRKQVRVFINDHTILSAIGNAYADEILFEAGIHPKTFVGKLTPDDIDTLFHSILHVMKWGIEKVTAAHRPIHVKVRDHVRVRNRKGKPCPRCGTTIRREGVRGHDVFFCPRCQPATRELFINW